MEKKPFKKHKYEVGANLWIEGSFVRGESAFVGKVIEQVTEYYTTLEGTKYPIEKYLVSCDEEHSRIDGTREIFATNILADYDDDIAMAKYRGGRIEKI